MKISSIKEMGAIVRAVRVALNVPLVDLAESLETSQTLLRRLEQGQSTIAVQKLFATLREIGIEVHFSLPPGIDEEAILAISKTVQKKRARP